MGQSKNIFIHIPKTGGSTFVGLLKESINSPKEIDSKPTHLTNQVGNVTIIHIDFSSEDRKIKSPHLFSLKNDVFHNENQKFFMLVRDPVDRIISEFNFQFHILNGKNGNPAAGIISRLPKIPNDIMEYIRFPHVQNYQLKFLLGRRLSDPTPVTNEEYSTVIQILDSPQFYCGTTDMYDHFAEQFQHKTGIQLKRTTTIRKETPKKLKQEIPESLKEEIRILNSFDQKLYEHVKENIIQDSQSEFIFTHSSKFIV
ncbi:MAG: sulfotransferase family 2 domain-containing protein [Flavobacteriales bacterium]|nr:sulfotransferase family 2 domain-containing protein [Flavobacteriales bacterium]